MPDNVLEHLERIADSLERLVIAADSIATALSLKTLTIERTEDCPVKDCPGKTYARFFADQGKRETLDELIARHERITEADSGH